MSTAVDQQKVWVAAKEAVMVKLSKWISEKCVGSAAELCSGMTVGSAAELCSGMTVGTLKVALICQNKDSIFTCSLVGS